MMVAKFLTWIKIQKEFFCINAILVPSITIKMFEIGSFLGVNLKTSDSIIYICVYNPKNFWM